MGSFIDFRAFPATIDGYVRGMRDGDLSRYSGVHILWCIELQPASGGELRAFGHDISILKNKVGQTQDQLSVDGKVIHANEYVSFDEIAVVNGTPIIGGDSSPGGNACDASPFVLSFPAGKAPRLWGAGFFMPE